MKSPNSKYLIDAPAFSEHHGRERPTNKTTDIYLSAINLQRSPFNTSDMRLFPRSMKLPAGRRSVVDAAVNSEPLHSGTRGINRRDCVRATSAASAPRRLAGIFSERPGRLLEQMDGLVTSAKSNGRGEAGRLSVGFFVAVGRQLRATLVDFRQRCPQVALGMSKGRGCASSPPYAMVPSTLS